ncbi:MULTISPECIES: L-lactate permease [unclassified Achromobacter]|uniref:L-lactate permease n=1 Tax=unclassified Achromobacter TaxID=2626865 RepID=UPI000B5161BA|nr:MULTISPECIES: L-lactate permease [unclassified Achromobacter]OWT80454.1 lactate transporter [Achromobacter sp. HZ34]OWT82337.1 lactate transporter [Achromobacter sp. HZ28]
MFQQIYDPVGGSLFLSSLCAALPLLAMFIMLGWLRVAPHLAALVSLVVCILVAVLAYRMPVGATLNSGVYGAAFSVLTVLWIIVNAIWLYNLTVKSGHFAILKDSFAMISPDPRIQAILIAYNFGALMEALAGAGTPIAISGAMLLAIGIRPIKAAVLALVANTAPVAFGALAVPITTLAQVTNIPFDHLGAIVGHQTPLIAAFVPLILVGLMDGKRGLAQVWPAAIVSGVGFGLSQWASATFISVALADVIGALGSAAALIVFLKVWRCPRPDSIDGMEPTAYGSGAQGNLSMAQPHSVGAWLPPGTPLRPTTGAMLQAYLPYMLIIAIFALAQMQVVKQWLAVGTVSFPWPGLSITNAAGAKVGTSFTLNSLSATGSLLLLSGILSALLLRVSAKTAIVTYGETIRQLRWAIPTVLCVLAIAFIMNYSGQTVTLGVWLAQTGPAFAFLSPVIGWIGVAVTGSDNSANALFGALQVAAANATGLNPALLAAANASGGVLGKMISPQSLAVGAAAVGIIGQEGLIFRKVIGWSVLLLAVLSLLVYLQTGPLAWMLPH